MHNYSHFLFWSTLSVWLQKQTIWQTCLVCLWKQDVLLDSILAEPLTLVTDTCSRHPKHTRFMQVIGSQAEPSSLLQTPFVWTVLFSKCNAQDAYSGRRRSGFGAFLCNSFEVFVLYFYPSSFSVTHFSLLFCV